MKRKLLVLIWLALVLLLTSCSSTTLPDGFQEAKVKRVVDGDTLVVTLDGADQRVRLILVDTPESVHPDESKNNEYGKLASDYTARQLPIGATIYLQKDVSETDRYNRLLRYVWIDLPADVEDEAEVREKMYNAKLLLEGYAQIATFPPDVKYVDMFTVFAAEAREADRGLWAYEEEAPENGVVTTAPVSESDELIEPTAEPSETTEKV